MKRKLLLECISVIPPLSMAAVKPTDTRSFAWIDLVSLDNPRQDYQFHYDFCTSCKKKFHPQMRPIPGQPGKGEFPKMCPEYEGAGGGDRT